MSKKKMWGLAFIGGVSAVLVILGGCGFAGYKLMSGVVNDSPGVTSRYLPVVSWCGNGLPFVSELKKILDGTYIVLLQNNNELRATGGFAGSYAKLKFSEGGLRSILVQDIYEPDGKLPGHVEPPYPIQEAFGQGWWKLRDANWDPDYASAAATVDWFMRQGGEREIDGIIAVNLGLLERWVGVLGHVSVMTYGVDVTEKNLYALAQTYAENRVEGNKTQKRQFLGALGAALVERTKSANGAEMMKFLRVVWEDLRRGQVLVWMKNPEVQADVEKMGWSGKITGKWDMAGDMVYVVDDNLGANKSDCCIERKLKQEVEQIDGKQRVKLTLIRKNDNPFETPKPPFSYGGQYVDYVRVVIPREAVNVLRVSVNGKELKKMEPTTLPNSLRTGRSENEYAIELRKDVVMVGFWLVVDAGMSGAAEVEYESHRSPNHRYEVFVRRQPGVESFGYQLIMDGKVRVNTDLDRDEQFKLMW